MLWVGYVSVSTGGSGGGAPVDTAAWVSGYLTVKGQEQHGEAGGNRTV